MSVFPRLDRAVGALALTVLLAVATGCGDDGGPYGDDGAGAPTSAPATTAPASPTPSPTATGSPSPGTGEPMVVKITMIDNQLLMERTDFPAGEYTFVAEQAGRNPHALSISGPGVNETTEQVEPGGGTVELDVTLQPGTYTLWCPVDGHRADGMEVTIEVT